MKHITLKKVPIISPSGEKAMLDYKQYLEMAVKLPLNGQTVGIDEMRLSIRVLDALSKATETGCRLEDADYQHLCLKVKAIKFNWVDPAFVQFVDDVTGVP